MIDRCPICWSTNIVIGLGTVSGYTEGTEYGISCCKQCNSQFAQTNGKTDDSYNLIYSLADTPGYARYHQYAKAIKKWRDPLRFLALHEAAYYPVYQYVKNREGLKILEIGCGYGYLSYSLKMRGFSVTGIDISSIAIDFAKRNFGDFFFNVGVGNLDEVLSAKYDLIIATEVIEHLDDPGRIIGQMKGLLNPDGRILLTTPNKDYWNKTALWQTDPPPVHLFWLGKKGIISLANRCSMQIEFVNFSHYYPRSENRLMKYIWSRKEPLCGPIMTREGKIHSKATEDKRGKFHRNLSVTLDKNSLVRNLSNFFFNLFNGSEITLAVTMRVDLGRNSHELSDPGMVAN